LARTHRVPQEHGRNAYLAGRCKCDEICRKAVREYSEQYARKRGIEPDTREAWTEAELEVIRSSDLPTEQLLALLPGRTFFAIERKRALIGAGLKQRGLPVPHPRARLQPAWNRKERLPLPELVRGSRVQNIRTGNVYRICGVHLNEDEPYVWLDRVDTMFSRLLKTPVDRLAERYQGLEQEVERVVLG
jgi:hypothetical protein